MECINNGKGFESQNWDRMEKYAQLCYSPTPSLRYHARYLNNSKAIRAPYERFYHP
jgi:hypothetical protein